MALPASPPISNAQVQHKTKEFEISFKKEAVVFASDHHKSMAYPTPLKNPTAHTFYTVK